MMHSPRFSNVECSMFMARCYYAFATTFEEHCPEVLPTSTIIKQALYHHLSNHSEAKERKEYQAHTGI